MPRAAGAGVGGGAGPNLLYGDLIGAASGYNVFSSVPNPAAVGLDPMSRANGGGRGPGGAMNLPDGLMEMDPEMVAALMHDGGGSGGSPCETRASLGEGGWRVAAQPSNVQCNVDRYT